MYRTVFHVNYHWTTSLHVGGIGYLGGSGENGQIFIGVNKMDCDTYKQSH